MTYSCWVPQVISGEYVLNTLFGLEEYGQGKERAWNGHPAQLPF